MLRITRQHEQHGGRERYGQEELDQQTTEPEPSIARGQSLRRAFVGGWVGDGGVLSRWMISAAYGRPGKGGAMRPPGVRNSLNYARWCLPLLAWLTETSSLSWAFTTTRSPECRLRSFAAALPVAM